jgi:hypothetical protein
MLAFALRFHEARREKVKKIKRVFGMNLNIHKSLFQFIAEVYEAMLYIE